MEANPYKKAMAIGVIALLFGVCAFGIVSEIRSTTTLPADNITIVDNLGNYTSDNVEGALQEIGSMLEAENLCETVSRTMYVDNDSGSDLNSGTSWADAFQTIQHATDTIKATVNVNVTITIRCRGTFSGLATPDGEGPTVIISRICFGTGIIEVLPEDYLREGSATAFGGDWAEFNVSSGSNSHGEDSGCWDNCLIFFCGSEGVAVGEVHKIISSVRTGDTMKVTFEDSFTHMPAGGDEWKNLFNIVGKATLVPGGWIGFQVDGALTKARIDGWVIEGFDGEAAGVKIMNGAYLRSQSMLMRNFVGGIIGYFTANSNSNMWVTESLCIYGPNSAFPADGYTSVFLDRASAAIGNFVSLRTDASDLASRHFYITNNSTLLNWGGSYTENGSANYWVDMNSTAFIGSPRGVDGADYGVRAEMGGMVILTDSSLTPNADAASFAYITDV